MAGMSEQMVTAVGMARDAGVCRKKFRRHLRRARLPWHALGDLWMVAKGSAQHQDMLRVLAAIER
jgi:hypothetical protein